MGINITIKRSLGSYTLDFQMQSEAKRIAILGASGSGKSLILKCIAGVECPDCGRIEIDGMILYDSAEKRNLVSRERHVGYLFQNYALFPTMTVAQNIAVGVRDKQTSDKIVTEFIKKYNLQGLEKHYPRQLSGGQQQRVALARMMAAEPEVILLDEPFSALDHYLREGMQRELLRYLEDYSGTVILVSHDRDEVYRLSEELVILEAGRNIAQGETTELFAKPGTVAAARLTGCKNIGEVAPGKGCYVEDWDVNLPVIRREKGCTHVGFRAHHIRHKKPESEPYFTIPVYQMHGEEGLWECTVSVKTSEKAVVPLCWKLSKDEWREINKTGVKQLYLAEKDLLFLGN